MYLTSYIPSSLLGKKTLRFSFWSFLALFIHTHSTVSVPDRKRQNGCGPIVWVHWRNVNMNMYWDPCGLVCLLIFLRNAQVDCFLNYVIRNKSWLISPSLLRISIVHSGQGTHIKLVNVRYTVPYPFPARFRTCIGKKIYHFSGFRLFKFAVRYHTYFDYFPYVIIEWEFVPYAHVSRNFECFFIF